MEQNNDSDPKFFIFGYIASALVIKEILNTSLEKSDEIWYLESEISKYFGKNKVIFKDLWLISIKFNITGKIIIYSQEVDTITIPFLNNKLIKLLNIALIAKYKSNFVFLDKLQKTGFIYYNKPIKMTLIKREKVVVHTRRDINLFILIFIKSRKAMVVGYGRPTHIVSKNK